MGSDAAQGMSRFCHLVNLQKKTNFKPRTFRTRDLNLRALQQLTNRLGKGGRKTGQAARQFILAGLSPGTLVGCKKIGYWSRIGVFEDLSSSVDECLKFKVIAI